jgi:RND family efflux transporter MFP subunit
MKRAIITGIVSAMALTGAYVWTFGVPGTAPADERATTQASASGPSGGGRSARGASTTTVVTAPLELHPYSDVLRAIGSAEALRSATVVTTVSGEVTDINLTANSAVVEGDILLQLDARTQALNLETAQAVLAQASDTVARYERLQTSKNSSITDVIVSEAKLSERLAQVDVGLAEVALDDRTVRAPITGKLGLSDVNVGDYLLANTEIVTVDNSDALLVQFELPERSIGMLQHTGEVLASTPTFSGQVFTGEIVSFDSRIDSVTRSVTVKARFENKEGLLWPGMTFAVRLIHDSEPLASVPSTAIVWSRDGSHIFVNNNGVAQSVAATILYRRDDLAWVDADIPAGTMVVTEGAHKLREGARIISTNPDDTSTPEARKKPANKDKLESTKDESQAAAEQKS